MLSIILDIAGAYLASKYIRNVWLLMLTAIVVGITSAILTNLLIYAFASNIFRPGEIMAKIVVGIIWHPLIALVAAIVFWRKARTPRNPEVVKTVRNG